jgi:hypothetical protein
MNYLTQNSVPLGNQISGLGKLGFEGASASTAPDVFTAILSTSIGLMTMIAGIWFMFVFITGAISIIGSGGEKGKYEAAQKKITTGLVGLVVVISAIFIVDFVGWIIGIDLINIAGLINLIRVP